MEEELNFKFDRGISKSGGASGINSSVEAQPSTLSEAGSASVMTNGSSASEVASSSTGDDEFVDLRPKSQHGRSG